VYWALPPQASWETLSFRASGPVPAESDCGEWGGGASVKPKTLEPVDHSENPAPATAAPSYESYAGIWVTR
jgi:hypothetical protein